MNEALEKRGWTFRKYMPEDAVLLWGAMADDVRREFEQEGLDELGAFAEDIESGDHIETWLLDGAVVCAFWSGWSDDFSARTFGCSVVKPELLKRKYAVARDSKAVTDEFMSREPSSRCGNFVLIPEWAKRLLKHAEQMAGLELVGGTNLPTGYYNIFRWKGNENA